MDCCEEVNVLVMSLWRPRSWSFI